MAKPKREIPLVPILLRFDPALRDRLKAYADEKKQPMAHVVSELVDRQLAVRGH